MCGVAEYIIALLKCRIKQIDSKVEIIQMNGLWKEMQ